MTAYPDLDALAARGDGTLWRYGERWTYPGAKTDGSIGAFRFIECVPNTRVQAAIASGEYVTYCTGNALLTAVADGPVTAVIAKSATAFLIVRSDSDLGTYTGRIGARELMAMPARAGILATGSWRDDIAWSDLDVF